MQVRLSIVKNMALFHRDVGIFPPRKNVEFYEDKELDQRFRSRLSDFKESGYDRGHMVMQLSIYVTHIWNLQIKCSTV